MMKTAACVIFSLLVLGSCEKLDDNLEKHSKQAQPQQVAKLLSVLNIGKEQMDEVHRAVSSSSGNGYDEEYLMSDLFEMPGKGVGETSTKSMPQYSRPLRDLLREYVSSATVPTRSPAVFVKSGAVGLKSPGDVTVENAQEGLGFVPDEAFLETMQNSDMQIYWPYSENWDGNTSPIISFDPDDGSTTNVGYRFTVDENGEEYVEMMTVDEQLAMNEPVWIVNTNTDSDYMTLDLMRKQDPSWGEGGTVIIHPGKNSQLTRLCSDGNSASDLAETKSGDESTDKSSSMSLILKEFVAKRNFDCWFAGASEFFVKAGAVEDFHASTEAELRLYSPSITDFMVVVKRSQVGQSIPFNAVLVSEWTQNMSHCAFMITEDDGGTITQWKCTAKVLIASKSYGIDIVLPFNSRDDIVWRGQLSRKYIENNSNLVGHFGDVDIVFETIEL